MEPEFQPYGLPHLTVISLTIVRCRFALAAIVWRTKSRKRKDDRECRPQRARLNLRGLFNFHPQPRHRDLATNAAHATVDWGMVVVIVAMWTGNQRWFEVAYFWGLAYCIAGCAHAKSAFWVSRLAIHQLFHLALRNHHRRRVPDVNSPIPAAIPCRSVRAFLWSEFYFLVTYITDKLTGFNYGFLLHKPEAFSILSFLSDSHPLYLL